MKGLEKIDTLRAADHFFTLTEKNFISLKKNDQEKMTYDIMEMGITIKELTRRFWELSKAKWNEHDYDREMEKIDGTTYSN